MAERAQQAVEEFPCDILIIHRDAEKESLKNRQREIRDAVGRQKQPPYVCLVPVRMTEAWLLVDESALRRAAGNPNGKVRLDLPRPNGLEDLPDPKDTLHRLLIEASELKKRARKKFRPERAVHRLAELVSDYSPLRDLNAFRAFSEELLTAVADISEG